MQLKRVCFCVEMKKEESIYEYNLDRKNVFVKLRVNVHLFNLKLFVCFNWILCACVVM